MASDLAVVPSDDARERHAVVRHLAFHDTRVDAMASWSEHLEEQFRGRLAVCVVKYLSKKDPGGTP